MTATARTRKGKLVSCKCRDFEAHVMVDGSDPDKTEIETTGCDRMTNRLFAQGHDAKLVSFLVAAELAGSGIAYGRSGGMLVSTDAIGAAKQISEALAAKTARALNKAEEKSIARQARQDTRARVKAEKLAKGPREVAAKVRELSAEKQIEITPADEARQAIAYAEAPADESMPEVEATDEATEEEIEAAERGEGGDVDEDLEGDPGRIAKIKVGRWTYDAIIDRATGVASYKTALGGSKIVKPGEFTEVS